MSQVHTSPDYVYLPVPIDRVEEVMLFLVSADKSQDRRIEDLVVRIYRESDEPFRKLLSYLAEHPDEYMSSARIAGALNLKSHAASLAGMLGAFGRRTTNRYTGFWPFDRINNPESKMVELIMSGEVAKLVKQEAS